MVKRIQAIISGAVQGVFFRSYTRQRAQSLNLTGWVANLHDGTVKVVAEGPENKLKELIRFLHDGSPQALVENVDVSWEEARLQYKDFSVRI